MVNMFLKISTSKKILASLLFIAVIFYTYFISQTMFYVNDTIYFTLIDDAMISMRYAQHLAHGFGMVWNTGETPVQGFTNLGWVLYMSLMHLLPISNAKISLTIMFTSIFILIFTALIIYQLTKTLTSKHNKSALISGLLTLFYFPLVFWSLRGMEVGLITLLIYTSVLIAYQLTSKSNYKTAFLLGILISSAILVRFDSLNQVGLIIIYLFYSGIKVNKHYIYFVPAFCLSISLGALLIFQYNYFGDIFPNTYYLKVEGVTSYDRISLGILTFFDYAVREFSPLLFIVLGGVVYYKKLQNKNTFLLLGLFLIQLVYSIYVGGDYAEPYNRPQVDAANRYITQGMPALFILFSLVMVQLIDDLLTIKYRKDTQVSIALALIIGVATLFIISSEPWVKWYENNAPLLKYDIWRTELGLHIKENTDKSATIAVHAAGQIPYYSERRTIDLLGKSDVYIAKLPPATKFRPGHNKWNYQYSIVKLQPDLVADEWGNLRTFLRTQKNYVRFNNKIHINNNSSHVNIVGIKKKFITYKKHKK